tara:strand:+ start:48 stop:968 length:921 start_codon:yes stop_codon:yes gene_type:complete
LGPARYDNPLADFLDRLPDYYSQFQRNELALKQQDLMNKRYEDSQKQQAYRNELTLINSLPESARAKAMLSSENEDIQEAGRAVEEESNAFDSMLNPSEVSESDSQQLDYYNNLLNNPSVRNNQARINQVKGRIRSVTNNLLQSQVQTWYESNKDNPNAKIILQQSQYDPSGAIKNITTLKDPKERKIIKGADGYNYYEDTKERVLPNTVKEAPKGATIKGLEAALSSIDRELVIFKSSMTPEQVLKKQRDRTRILDKLQALTLDNQVGGLNIPPPGSSTAESTRTRFPGMNQAPAESTKIKIPGF